MLIPKGLLAEPPGGVLVSIYSPGRIVGVSRMVFTLTNAGLMVCNSITQNINSTIPKIVPKILSLASDIAEGLPAEVNRRMPAITMAKTPKTPATVMAKPKK